MMDLWKQTYWVKIIVYGRYRTVIESHVWTDLRQELRLKYHWYFKYRAALAQVRHPKADVHFESGTKEPSQKTEVQILENRLRAKKGKHTEWRRKIEAYQRTWCSLFPIEDDEQYKAALAKLTRLQVEIRTLEESIAAIS